MKTSSLALVLFQAIAIVLVGCSTTEPKKTISSPTPPPTPPPTSTVAIAPTAPSAASLKPKPSLAARTTYTASQLLQQTKFICSEWNGYPATMAKISRGSIPMFLWESEYFKPSGYDPQTRCKHVSARLQEYHTEGKLHYIGTDYMHNYPILCVADNMPGNCLTNHKGEPLLLVTLQPEHDPVTELEKVLTVRDSATDPIKYYTGKGVVKYDPEGDLFLDLKKYVEELLTQYQAWEELQQQFNSEVNNYIQPD